MKKVKLPIILMIFIISIICFCSLMKKSLAADAAWSAQTISSSTTKTISGTITMNGTTTINSGATLTINGNGTIKRGSSHKGILFQINDGGKLIIRGSTGNNNDIVIDGGSSANCENVIRVNESMDLTNVTIQNNYVYSSTDGDTSKSYSGGAIFVTSTTDINSNIILSNCRIANCRAVEASGIYLNGGGAANVTISRTVFENCHAIDKGISSTYGGLIRTNGNGKYKMTISDSVIRNNTSFRFGGGIYWNANTQSSMLTIDDCHILGNSAGMRGGGIFLEGNNISIQASEGTLTEALTTGNINNEGITGTLIQGNDAGDYGGGLCFKTYSNSSNISVEDTIVTLSNNIIFNQNTATNGASIAFVLDSSDNYVEGAKFEFNINGSYFTNNVATNSGGAMYIQKNRSDYITQTNIIKGIFSNNQAINGGAICITTAEGLSNVAKDTVIIGTSGDANEQIFIENNQATNGGGIFISNGDITMNGGLISKNNSIDGGAVYITDGKFLMTSGEITYNVASNEGGAVYANGGSIVIGIKDCTDENNLHESQKTHPIVSENVAVYGGGGFMTDGTLTMYCGTIRGNTSNNEGTGNNIYMNGGSFELAGGSVGEETNPGIVLVGGELNDSREDDTTQGEEIIMIYHSCLDSGVEHKVSVTAGKYVNLPAAQSGWVKEGHTMVGWTTIENAEVRAFEDYKSVGMAIKVDNADTNKELHYYAVWVKTTSTITYNLEGGTVTGTNATSYNYSVISESLQLISPEKEYYNFIGWSLTASEETKTNWETYYPEGEKSVFYSVEDPESGLDLNIGTHFGDITLTAIYETIMADIQINISNSMAKNQSYILNIKGTQNNTEEFTPLKVATITDENGSSSVIIKDIPIGTYTVELQGDWSWRYGLSENNIQSATNIKVDESQETHIVNFEEFNIKNNSWLNHTQNKLANLY